MEHRDTVLNLVTPLNFIHRNHFHGLERDTELYFSVPRTRTRVNVYTCDAFSDLCLRVAGRGARGWNILVRSAAAVCGGNWAANVIVYLALPRVIFTQILFYHSSPVPV